MLLLHLRISECLGDKASLLAGGVLGEVEALAQMTLCSLLSLPLLAALILLRELSLRQREHRALSPLFQEIAGKLELSCLTVFGLGSLWSCPKNSHEEKLQADFKVPRYLKGEWRCKCWTNTKEHLGSLEFIWTVQGPGINSSSQ